MGKIFNHTKAGELGSFIIGDVVLSIPPSAITTTRIENNEEITALRSKYPMLRKTGQSIMTVTVMWQAVLEYNGMTPIYTEWEKLRRVFAIFKCAPFVQVQNDHLRTVLNMQDSYNRMVFGLKNLTISTSPDSTDILEARLDMIFLNYLPYSKDFSYTDSAGKKNVNANNSDLFTSYIDMWMSQNMDTNLTDHGIKDWKNNNTGTTNLIYNLYKAFPMPLVPTSDPSWTPDLLASIPKSMITLGKNGPEAYLPIMTDPSGWTLDHDAQSSRYSFFYLPQILEFTADNSGNSGDTFTTGVIISATNKLARIPLSSYQFPTYQHLGPGTTTIGISLQDNDPEAYSLGDVQQILNKMNNQFFTLRSSWRKTRTIHRMQAIYIENQILNMFGVRSILPDSLKTSTSQEGLFVTAELLGTQYENIFEAKEPFTIRDPSTAYLNAIATIADPSSTANMSADQKKSISALIEFQTAKSNNDLSYIESKLSQIPGNPQLFPSFAAGLGQLPQLPYSGSSLDYNTLWSFSGATWNGFNAPINTIVPGMLSRVGSSLMSWTDMVILTGILKSGNFGAMNLSSSESQINNPNLYQSYSFYDTTTGQTKQVTLNYNVLHTALDTYGKAQSPTYQSIMYQALFLSLYAGGGQFKNDVDMVSTAPQYQQAITNNNAAQDGGPGSDPINNGHGAYNDLGLTGLFASGTSFSPAYYLYDYSKSNLEDVKTELLGVLTSAQTAAQSGSASTTMPITGDGTWTHSDSITNLPTQITGPNATAFFSRVSFDVNNPSTMYPTFKLFLIEDAAGTIMYAYDDFYSYASVQSIEVIKYRGKPDAALIKLSNLSGILSHRLYDNSVDGARENSLDTAYDFPSGGEQESTPEGIVTKGSGYRQNGIMYADGLPAHLKYYAMQTGSKIQVRMGYNDNPDKLFPVFSGVVTEISEENEMITLMAQSFMTELLDIPDGGFTPTNGWDPISAVGDTIYFANAGFANLFKWPPSTALSSFWDSATAIVHRSPAFGGGFATTDGTTDAVLAALIQSPTAKHFGKWQIDTMTGGQDPFIRGFAWGPTLANVTWGAVSNALASSYDRSAENILINQVIGLDGSITAGSATQLNRVWNFENSFNSPARYSIPPDSVEPPKAPWVYMKDISRRRPDYILTTKTYGFPWNCDATLVYASPLDFYRSKPYILPVGGSAPTQNDSKTFQTWWSCDNGKLKFLALAPLINSLVYSPGAHSIIPQGLINLYSTLGIASPVDPVTQAKKIDASGNPDDLTNYIKNIQSIILKVYATNPLMAAFGHIEESGVGSYIGLTSTQTKIDNLRGSFEGLQNSLNSFIAQTNNGGLGTSPNDCVQPVRKYHYVSQEHIIHNGITLNGQIYNTVKVADQTMCANGAIPSQHRRLLDCDPLVVDPNNNVKGLDVIRAGYAQSFLSEELEKMYGGEILLRGYPEIEPHDVLAINDPALCMKGPIVVDKVIHSFHPDEGFITIVTPSLLVNNNEVCQASILNTYMYAAGKVLVGAWDKFTNNPISPGGLAIGAGVVGAGEAAIAIGSGLISGTFLWPVAALGALAMSTYGINYFMSEAKNALPMFCTPLTRYGKVWAAGIEGFRMLTLTDIYKDRFKNFTASEFWPLIESWRTLAGATQVGIGAVTLNSIGGNGGLKTSPALGFSVNPQGQLIGVQPQKHSVFGSLAPIQTQYISQYATKYNVPVTLANAIAWIESSGNPNPPTQPQGNNSHAYGTFQLEPGTAKQMGVTVQNNSPVGIEQNIMGGVKYISTLLQQFGNNTTLAVAAYFAGPGAVNKYGPGIPPLPSGAMQYVVNVLNAMKTQS